MRIFLVAAAVLFAFAICAFGSTTGTFIDGIAAGVWLAAGLLAWVLDQLLGARATV